LQIEEAEWYADRENYLRNREILMSEDGAIKRSIESDSVDLCKKMIVEV